MKLTISWLKDFLDTDKSIEEIIEGLTKIGLEVEEVVNQLETYKNFIIAEVIDAIKHPEADKLRVCKVDTGKEILQIVCGAPNARKGIKVVLAPIGTEIPSNKLIIKESKIRNQLSQGMLCSASELDLGADSEGIIELPENFEIGKSFANAYGLDEVLIELSITPNRGDCLGIYGIARDLAAAGYGTLKPLDIKIVSGSFKSPIQVDLKNPNACPKFIGRYFKNVKNGDSPEWLKKKLKSIGEKSISTLVDITNYFTYSFNRPLHVFDADLIEGDLIVKKAVQGDELLALNDKTYKFSGDELCIYDNNKPLAIAGVIGGKDSGVLNSSKNIFLEIGYFLQDEIVIASRYHHIDTDSKRRFERGVDPEFMQSALNLASEMILSLCGGEPSESVTVDNLNYTKRKIYFPLVTLKKKLGIEYRKEKVIKILTGLGYIIEDKEEGLNLEIPSWRHDISTKENIVEEIARIDGYENVSPEALPIKEQGFKVLLDEKQRRFYNLSRFAANLGLYETYTCSFMHSKNAALFADLKEELYLKNPISSELNYMRPSMLPNFLDAVKKNSNRGITNIALFELALIYEGLAAYQQKPCISGIRSGNTMIKNIYKEQRKVDFFDAKADTLAILEELGFDSNKAQLKTDNLPKYFHPGRAACVTLGKNILGFFGQIHPKILQEYDINEEVVGFEIFLDNIPLPRTKLGRKGAIELSDYQATSRDFAFIVDENITACQMSRTILQVDKNLIKDLNFFDVYQGDKIEKGKKSIAFSILIQALNRTLSEKELEELSQKIITSMVNNCGAALRGV